MARGVTGQALSMGRASVILEPHGEGREMEVREGHLQASQTARHLGRADRTLSNWGDLVLIVKELLKKRNLDCESHLLALWGHIWG